MGVLPAGLRVGTSGALHWPLPSLQTALPRSPPPPAVLGLAHYPALLELLQPRMKREMATRVVQGLLKGGTRVASLDKVEMLFR